MVRSDQAEVARALLEEVVPSETEDWAESDHFLHAEEAEGRRARNYG